MNARFVLALFSMAAFSSAVSATSASDTQRFHLVGEGTLHPDQPVQKSGNLHLKATLTQSAAIFAASPTIQEGGGFALTASLAAQSMVCYNDTIFRDDFDGDGF